VRCGVSRVSEVTWISGFGFQVSSFGFWVSGLGLQILDFGFRVSVFGFRVSDFGFRVSGVGCSRATLACGKRALSRPARSGLNTRTCIARLRMRFEDSGLLGDSGDSGERLLWGSTSGGGQSQFLSGGVRTCWLCSTHCRSLCPD